jgi:hypothetical protein
MNKKIFTIAIIFGLFFSPNVFAAHLVPKTAPLQPLPVNIAPNISHNVNTPNSPSNQALQQASKQAQQALTPQNNQTNQQIPQNPQILIPNQSAQPYVWLLIFGLLGLIAVGIWVYIRFIRNNK